MILQISILLYLSFVFETHSYKKEVKRILLNDPGYYESRISHLESLTQQLIVKNNALESQLKTIQSQKDNKDVIVMPQCSYTEAFVFCCLEKMGDSFIHWGRKTCNNQTAETIYSGFTASGYYNEPGTGVNFLCLPRDPQFTNRSAATIAGNAVDYLHGTEFETNFFADNSQDEDVPCAACESSGATLMIPGRTSCYQGWTEQYSGYLATNYHKDLAQKDYICVDKNPEYLFSGSSNANGAVLYPVVYTCSSLQCPPYLEGEAATCVVCSK